ncbi:MAG: hypothetical protein QXL54_03735 [Candidatus Bathyarchaeia archaeon]
MKKAATLAIFLTFSAFLGYAFGLYMQPKNQEPAIKGTVTFALEVYNVEDLLAWQAIIVYNPEELKVLNIIPGGFLGTDYLSLKDSKGFSGDSIFVNSTDSFEDSIIIGGFLLKGNGGRDGSGRLAYVVFGYFEESHHEPYIISNKLGFKTMLLNSALTEIPFTFLNHVNSESSSSKTAMLAWIKIQE